jgi:predicted dehydrogenase
MKKLRVGVIGLGMGRAHIKGYQSHPEAEVVAIADIDEKRLQAAGDEFKVPGRYATAAKMLKKEKLDVVSVVTPNKFHKPLTLAALQAGCHVLCEKPMAMNAAEARTMLAAAKKARRRLMINFSYRFSEQSWALKKQVDSGILGHVYFGRTIWHRRRGMPGFGGSFGQKGPGGGGWFGRKSLAGGGPLIDLGVHRLDLALWLMGHPKPVWAMGSTYDHIAGPIAKARKMAFDVEDLAVGLVKFSNGATLEIEASWAANIAENEMMETRLLGTKGGLVQHNTNEGYSWDAKIFVEREGAQFDMKLHPPVPAVRGPMYHFIESIITNKPHLATGDEGLMVMEILDAIYASAKTGKPVKF